MTIAPIGAHNVLREVATPTVHLALNRARVARPSMADDVICVLAVDVQLPTHRGLLCGNRLSVFNWPWLIAPDSP